MRRIAFAIVVGLLAVSASGMPTLVAGEPCSAYELTGQGEDEGSCPPTCVTCGCCARAAEAVTFAATCSPDAAVPDTVATLPSVPAVDPRDILHVPKPFLA